MIFAVAKLLLHKSIKTVSEYYLNLTLEEALKMAEPYLPITFRTGAIRESQKSSQKNIGFKFEVNSICYPHRATVSNMTLYALKLLWESHNVSLDQEFDLSKLDWQKVENKLGFFDKKTTRKTYRYLIRTYLRKFSIEDTKTNNHSKSTAGLMKSEWGKIYYESLRNKRINICFFVYWAYKNHYSPQEITNDVVVKYIEMAGLKQSRVFSVIREWNVLYPITPHKLNQIPRRLQKRASLPKNERPPKLKYQFEEYKSWLAIEQPQVSNETIALREWLFWCYLYDLKHHQLKDIYEMDLKDAFEIGKEKKGYILNFIARRAETDTASYISLYLNQIDSEKLGEIPWILFNKSKNTVL